MYNNVRDYLKKALTDLGVTTAAVLPIDGNEDLIKENHAASRMPKGASTVLVALFPYYTGELEKKNVCRYATLSDYHKIVTDLLTSLSVSLNGMDTPVGEYAAFTDNSPFKEVELAIRAGLGFRAKNNLLISKKHGSYQFIGELVTEIPLPIGNVFGDDEKDVRSCRDCRRCEFACPTGCITEGGMDYSSCVSAITQKKGELSSHEENAIRSAASAWGCDRCQEVCPYNKNAVITGISQFTSDVSPMVTTENLDELLLSRAFAWRGKAVMERNLGLILK